MSATILPFEIDANKGRRTDGSCERPRAVGVRGGVTARFAGSGGRTIARKVRERDGYKIRFVRERGNGEAILINTGGGLVAGDEIGLDFELEDEARVTVTTQACERVYRSHEQRVTRMSTRLVVGKSALMTWLPQETILYDGCRFDRSLDIDLSVEARGIFCETIVFGRRASGERLTHGKVRDQWRVRRGGRLVFAEATGLDASAYDGVDRPAMLGCAQYASTLLYVAGNAEDCLDPVRRLLDTNEGLPLCAASAWNELLCVRALGVGGDGLRRMLAALVPALVGRELPRAWWI